MGTDNTDTSMDEAALRAALNVLRDSVEAGRMPSEGAAGVLGAEGSQSTPAVATIAGLKTFEKTRDASDELLPDDYILVCVYPKTKDEKLEVDKLGAIVDSMNRLRVNEETPVSEDTETVLQTAIDALMQRIKDMGGTSAMKKAEEKLKARRA